MPFLLCLISHPLLLGPIFDLSRFYIAK
jgi:hypothetical protein